MLTFRQTHALADFQVPVPSCRVGTLMKRYGCFTLNPGHGISSGKRPLARRWHCFSETVEVSTNLSLILPPAERGRWGGEGHHSGKSLMAMRKPLFNLLCKHRLVGAVPGIRVPAV